MIYHYLFSTDTSYNLEFSEVSGYPELLQELMEHFSYFLRLVFMD